MLTISNTEQEAIVNRRLAIQLRQALENDLPEMVRDMGQELSIDKLCLAVREVRPRLRVWGMETERVVLKYLFGSILIGCPLEEKEPRVLLAFNSAESHRYKKEEFMDRVIEFYLAPESTR